MLLKKRQVLTATLIIALCAAITVNWYFSKPENSDAETTTSANEAVTGNLGDTLFVAGTTAISNDITSQENENLSDDETESAETVSAENYFSSAKLKRQNAYDETIENIEKILSDESVDSSQKSEITIMLSDYQSDMKAQTDAENLITAKTGSECLVVINGDECQVILEKNTLTDTLILQITEIIEKNTNIISENLTIIELK